MAFQGKYVHPYVQKYSIHLKDFLIWANVLEQMVLINRAAYSVTSYSACGILVYNRWTNMKESYAWVALPRKQHKNTVHVRHDKIMCASKHAYLLNNKLCKLECHKV